MQRMRLLMVVGMLGLLVAQPNMHAMDQYQNNSKKDQKTLWQRYGWIMKHGVPYVILIGGGLLWHAHRIDAAVEHEKQCLKDECLQDIKQAKEEIRRRLIEFATEESFVGTLFSTDAQCKKHFSSELLNPLMQACGLRALDQDDAKKYGERIKVN